MAEYIERTEELLLAMNAGARAIENTKRYHGTVYTKDVFSESPQEIPYLQAAKVLREVSDAPAADVAPVVHGRWIFTKRHLWYKDENGNIDEWRVDNGFHNGPECQICHTAFCEHCTPDWLTTECKIGHYYCSECAETSRDAHENYCPNCGAKMDGGDGDAAD
jgi:hypothetical protein|nr:MAG TPA: GENERAL NEGATIVE REGULATOR OF TRANSCRIPTION, SIGNALING PROTEIN, NOT4 RING.8A [Caudoviricetes sp.]